MKVVRRTPEEVVKLWIKTLRSGKYKQTDRKLRDDKGFCCLGVLCDLATKDGGPKWIKTNGRWEFAGMECSLPEVIKQYIRLANYMESSLITKNDMYGQSFKEIADYIEQMLLPELSTNRTKV